MTVQAEGLTEDTEDLKIDEPVGINDLPPEVRKSPKRVKKVEKISKQSLYGFLSLGGRGGDRWGTSRVGATRDIITPRKPAHGVIANAPASSPDTWGAARSPSSTARDGKKI